MKYSPKLKTAMEEIKTILEKYDIAGVVVLHTPGNSEYLIKLNPSYSCVYPMPNGFRIRAKLQEDYNGDKEKMRQVVGDSANMLSLLATTSGQCSLNIMKLSNIADEQFGAEHTSGEHSGNDEIFN